MIRALVAALALAVVASAVHAAGAPVVRAKVAGKSEVLVGQQFKVEVEVLVPNFFQSAPAWPSLSVPGAVVTPEDGTSGHLTETIGGESYAGIRQTYLVVPQRAGEFTLPSAKVTFKYAAEPGKPPANGSVTIPPVRFTAKAPAGATGAGASAAPVARVTVKQTLDRGLDGVKAGDALSRTIDVTAERTQAMMIPPPTFVAPDGVRVYAKDPTLDDRKGPRGEFLGGHRVDRVTYLFEKPGDYTLPAIEIPWFDAASGKREAAVAPAIHVVVAANPAFKPDIAPEAPPGAPPPAAPTLWQRVEPWLPWAAAMLFATGGVAWLVRRYAPRIRDRLAAKRREDEASEATAFATLDRACNADDAKAAYRAAVEWARRTGASSLAALRLDARDADLDREIDSLERALFAAPPPAHGWRGRPLAVALAAVRKRGLVRPDRVQARGPALPALNP